MGENQDKFLVWRGIVHPSFPRPLNYIPLLGQKPLTEGLPSGGQTPERWMKEMVQPASRWPHSIPICICLHLPDDPLHVDVFYGQPLNKWLILHIWTTCWHRLWTTPQQITNCTHGTMCWRLLWTAPQQITNFSHMNNVLTSFMDSPSTNCELYSCEQRVDVFCGQLINVYTGDCWGILRIIGLELLVYTKVFAGVQAAKVFARYVRAVA